MRNVSPQRKNMFSIDVHILFGNCIISFTSYCRDTGILRASVSDVMPRASLAKTEIHHSNLC